MPDNKATAHDSSFPATTACQVSPGIGQGLGSQPPRPPPATPPPPPLLSQPKPFDLGPTYNYRPFLSEQLLDDESPPPTAWKDFQRPLHRQFPGNKEDITWRSYLGHGLDGVVFKASIDGQVFAIKVFWHARPPVEPPHKGISTWYWAFPRECHVVATLDKIKWILGHTETPILVHTNPTPKSSRDAAKNLYAFSDEGWAKPQTGEGVMPFPPSPPITHCYGWLQLDTAKLPRRFHHYLDIQRLRGYRAVGVHYAMVYEYVPNTAGEQDPVEVMQAQLDAFYLAGFALNEIKLDNWIQGRLVDFCDLTALVDPWAPSRWRRRDAGPYLKVPTKAQGTDGDAVENRGERLQFGKGTTCEKDEFELRKRSLKVYM